MDQERKLLIMFEIIMCLVIFLVCVAVCYPIWARTNAYPFYLTNCIFITSAILGVRYLFALDYSLLGREQKWKIGLILASVPFGFFLISSMTEFLAYVEGETFVPITGHLPDADKAWTDKYIWGQMIFFAVASILSCFALPVRLFMSVWKQRNTKKKRSVFFDTDEY
jgi:hypothetical protein